MPTIAKPQSRPATMHDKGGLRGHTPTAISIPVTLDGPGTLEEGHVDSLLGNLEGAINDLESLQSRLAARLAAELARGAQAIKGAFDIASYVGYADDAEAVATAANMMDGVRYAHAIDKNTLSFSATPAAARQVAFAFNVTASRQEEAELNSSHPHFEGKGEEEAKPWWCKLEEQHKDVEESVSQSLEERVANCAHKLNYHYGRTPGIFGINALPGKVVVTMDENFPRNARIAMRRIAKPYEVECEFQAANFSSKRW